MLGITPKKGLSQNFLIDGNIIRKIVSTAAITPGDAVLEIGPGPGALTEALLEAGAHVTAVEKDAVLARELRNFQTADNALTVVEGDILKCNFSELFSEARYPVKVVANLPYKLTTAIFETLIAHREFISEAVVMVQEEVARRLTASPGGKDYGSSSVHLNFFAKVTYAFKVGCNCFFPVPKVDSAVVKIAFRPPPDDVDTDRFFLMTRTAFGQRRKMVKSTLKKLAASDAVADALQAIGCDPLSRPEQLSLEQWIQLYRRLFSEER